MIIGYTGFVFCRRLLCQTTETATTTYQYQGSDKKTFFHDNNKFKLIIMLPVKESPVTLYCERAIFTLRIFRDK